MCPPARQNLALQALYAVQRAMANLRRDFHSLESKCPCVSLSKERKRWVSKKGLSSEAYSAKAEELGRPFCFWIHSPFFSVGCSLTLKAILSKIHLSQSEGMPCWWCPYKAWVRSHRGNPSCSCQWLGRSHLCIHCSYSTLILLASLQGGQDAVRHTHFICEESAFETGK